MKKGDKLLCKKSKYSEGVTIFSNYTFYELFGMLVYDSINGHVEYFVIGNDGNGYTFYSNGHDWNLYTYFCDENDLRKRKLEQLDDV